MRTIDTTYKFDGHRGIYEKINRMTIDSIVPGELLKDNSCAWGAILFDHLMEIASQDKFELYRVKRLFCRDYKFLRRTQKQKYIDSLLDGDLYYCFLSPYLVSNIVKDIEVPYDVFVDLIRKLIFCESLSMPDVDKINALSEMIPLLSRYNREPKEIVELMKSKELLYMSTCNFGTLIGFVIACHLAEHNLANMAEIRDHIIDNIFLIDGDSLTYYYFKMTSMRIIERIRQGDNSLLADDELVKEAIRSVQCNIIYGCGHYFSLLLLILGMTRDIPRAIVQIMDDKYIHDRNCWKYIPDKDLEIMRFITSLPSLKTYKSEDQVRSLIYDQIASL